jgi:hypothetical protein
MKNVHQSPPQTVADLIEDKLDLSPEFINPSTNTVESFGHDIPLSSPCGVECQCVIDATFTVLQGVKHLLDGGSSVNQDYAEFHSNVAAAARHLCAILCNG